MKRVRPKKKFGQHFLNDASIAQRIAASLNWKNGCLNVLEIGPGTGMLTRALIAESGGVTDRTHNLKFVEVDREALEYLRKTHPEWEANLIPGDFLYLDPNEVFGGEPFAVIGNFPYNISSQILFKAVENRDLVQELVGMFQREVARRVVSGPHSKEYGILSVLIQAFYDVEYLFTVDENSFNPPPKVKSGVIRLHRNDRQELPIPFPRFKLVVKTAFGTRRKTLRNSLKPLMTPEVNLPEELLALRAENLTPDDFISVAVAIYGNA